MKKAFLIGVVWSLVVTMNGLLWAESPEVSVEMDKETVALGDSVQLTLTVQADAGLSPPELPPIPDFDVRYVGSRRESYSSLTVVVQGKRVEKRQSGGGTLFEYALTPKKTGVLTVPQFVFTVGGQRYRTHQPYVIHVVDAPASSEEILVRLSANRQEVYLGERVVVTFEWLLNRDVRGYLLTLPWFGSLKDFLMEEPERDPNGDYLPLIVNGKDQVIAGKGIAHEQGKRYTALSFQRILTPISAGTYTLDPAFLKCEVVKGYERSPRENIPFFRHFDFDDFFGRGRRAITESAVVRSQPLTLRVKPLPTENRPDTFTGAVGQFDFRVAVEPRTVSAGEPITVTLKVIGSGNFNEVEFPPFPELPPFKGYEPEVKLETTQKGELVIGEKAFEKILVGRLAGTHQIPPLSFTFFDPGLGVYQTLTGGPFTVQVQPGTGQEEPLSTVQRPEAKSREKEIKVMTRDVRYIKSALGLVQREGRPLYRMPLFWWIGFVPLPCLTAAAFFIRRRQLRFERDVGYARRARAFKKSQRELEASGRWLREGKPDEFYAGISKVLRQYLGDKLNRSPGGITADVVDLLKERKLDPALLRELADCFERIDLAKFSAAKGGAQQMEELLHRIKTLVPALERALS